MAAGKTDTKSGSAHGKSPFSTARDILVLVAALLVLCSLFGGRIGAQLQALAGDWDSSQSERSELENKTYAAFPGFDFQSFSTGDFQDDMETWAAQHVPVRDTLLLANASAQRLSIESANLLFGFECYPAFFGSGKVKVPGHEAVLSTLPEATQDDAQAADTLCARINELAARHPEVDFVYDDLITPNASTQNPSSSLVTNALDEDWARTHIEEKLSESVHVVADSIASEDELYGEWNATDPHWGIDRALESYGRIAQAAGLEDAGAGEKTRVVESWQGANARSGLCLDYSDTLYDRMTRFPTLSCTIDGKEAKRGRRAAYLDAWEQGEQEGGAGKADDADGADGTAGTGTGNAAPTNSAGGAGSATAGDDMAFEAYTKYYGGVVDEVVWHNSDAEATGNCLLVGRSYATCLEPYIAQNFSTTVRLDPVNKTVGTSIETYIEDYDIDTVIFLFEPHSSVRTMLQNSPDFL